MLRALAFKTVFTLEILRKNRLKLNKNVKFAEQDFFTVWVEWFYMYEWKGLN